MLKLVLTIFLISSCRTITAKNLLTTPTNSESSNPVLISASQFVKDGLGGLFKKEPAWYIYDDINHFIYSRRHVYVIKSKGIDYKIQFLGYYDNSLNPESGFYTFRHQELTTGPTQTVKYLSALACGTVYSPSYSPDCESNLNKNRFTYFSLSQNRDIILTDLQAKNSTDWDIAFKRSEILLNSGTSGPGDVRGSIAYFNPDNQLENIIGQNQQDLLLDQFDLVHSSKDLAFYYYDGIDFVIQKKDWLLETSAPTAVEQNFWAIKSAKGDSIFGLSVKKIDYKDGFYHLTLKIMDQDLSIREIQLAKINKRKQIKCLNLTSGLEVSCQKNEEWDLLFDFTTRNQDYNWIIKTNSTLQGGAIGPFTENKTEEFLTNYKE